jgi:hypothetical protein
VIAGCAVLMWMQRADIAYFFSSREPVVLGAEGDYHFELLAPNRFARVHGVPGVRGAWSTEGSDHNVIVAIRDTPLLVVRPPVGGEEWKTGSTPPQPLQTPFAVGGRVVQCTLTAKGDGATGCAEGGKYEDAFGKIAGFGEVRARDGKLWMIISGAKPGEDSATLAWMTAFGLLALLNAWFVYRDVSHRLRARQS